MGVARQDPIQPTRGGLTALVQNALQALQLLGGTRPKARQASTGRLEDDFLAAVEVLLAKEILIGGGREGEGQGGVEDVDVAELETLFQRCSPRKIHTRDA